MFIEYHSCLRTPAGLAQRLDKAMRGHGATRRSCTPSACQTFLKGLSAPCRVRSMLCDDAESLRRAERVRAGCQRRRRRRWQTWWRGCISEPERRPTAEQCAEVISSFLPGVARKTSGRTASGEVGRFKRASSGAQPTSPVRPCPSRAAATCPNRLAATHRSRLEALPPDQTAAASHALRMAEPTFC